MADRQRFALDKTDQNRLASGMTLRYLVVVLLLALFAVGTHLLLKSLVAVQTTSAAEINLAGRQRMLFNRILLMGRKWTLGWKSAGEARKQNDLLYADLLKHLELMQKSHHSLLHGDPLLGIAPPQTAALRALYLDEPEAVDRHVQAFLAQCRALLEQKDSTDQNNPPTGRQTFLDLEIDTLLVKLDKVVVQYQHDAETRLTDLMHTMTVFLWIQLALLLISALFVFRPMVHHLKRYIEEQAQARESLRVAMEVAQAATQAKGDFLANMSHEIRTPMNAIIGLSHLCLQTHLSVRQKDYLRKVHSSAVSLLRIINDILDFSKIEAGRLDMESIPFTLEEVLGSMASMIALKAQEKKLEFLMETGTDIPPSLLGDPLRLGQILINLTNNAIKFTEAGEVVVKTTLLEQGEDFVRLQFVVQDTGIGMTQTQLDGLFRAFSQADTSITRKFGGTGLGLTIAKRLIEMMGGTIRVESMPDQGTRFTFDIRLGLSNQSTTKMRMPTANLRGLRVLVVDDNESARNIIGDYLTSFTFRVTKAPDAKTCILAVQEAEMVGDPFELVVIDYMMPEMDGITAVATMRNTLQLNRMPMVIMATAYGESQVVQRATSEAQVDGFLVKPIHQSLLFESVMEVFGQTQPQADKAEETERNPTQDFMRVLSGAKILLVEDNEINQQVAQELLELANITVVLAQNGKEAVDWVFKEPLDGVLMDLHMPVMDGITATRKIRHDGRFAHLPILAMTANAMSSDRELCLAVGMQDHIAKPVDPTQLYATLARWIKPAHPKPLPVVPKQAILVHIETFPDIPGLDIPEAVRRMGDNIQGYRDLLIKFSINHRKSITAIRAALESADTPTAERLAHTLKGVAGTIGADLLEAHAKSLERAIKAKERLESMEDRLQEAEEELSTLCADIGHALNPTKPEVLLPSAEATEEGNPSAHLFRQLAKQLAGFDAEADHTLATLRATVRSEPLLSWMIQLEKEVASYEFEKAAETLKQCSDALGIDLNVEDKG